MAKTGKITALNGWRNLGTEIGSATLAKRVQLYNGSATQAYVHVNDGGTQPATGADGYPFASATAPATSVILENVDLAGVWIFTAGAIDIKYLVN